MKRLFQFSIASLYTIGAFAQCELTIPPDAQPIAMVADTTIDASEGYYWICEGVTAHFSGETNVIVAEEGTMLHIFGDNNIVITKAEVMIHGDNTNVYAVSEEMVDDMGNTTNTVICSEVVFDLSTAPPNGCMSLSVDELQGLQLRIHPNPAQDHLQISATQGRLQGDIRITDLQGRLWTSQSITGTTRIDISSLPAGNYLISYSTEVGKVVRKFRKN